MDRIRSEKLDSRLSELERVGVRVTLQRTNRI